MTAAADQTMKRWLLEVGRDLVVIVVLSFAVALLSNAVRSDGLPMVASEPYTIVVPCPEPGGEAEAIDAAAALRDPAQTLRIDARAAADFEARHADDAINVPYDFLEPTPAATVQRIAGSARQRVVVYGDGAEPDSGEELARELTAAGIRNVAFVRGGAAALFGAQVTP